MPLTVNKRGDKYRIVEPNGRIAKNAAGTAIDGGGRKTKASIEKQIQAINISKEKR